MKAYFKKLAEYMAVTALCLSLYGLLVQSCETLAAALNVSNSTIWAFLLTICILGAAIKTAAEIKEKRKKLTTLDLAIEAWKETADVIKRMQMTDDERAEMLAVYDVTIETLERERERKRRRKHEN